MLCQSCGASSSNDQVCDYCGVKLVLKDISDFLRTEDSKRAQVLGLKEELSYIFNDKDNSDQVSQRLFEKIQGFIDDLDLKRAEFLSKLALQETGEGDEALLFSAEVKTLYGEKLTGSIQSANIKQKYILDARDILNKVSSSELEGKVNELSTKLDAIEGIKAGQFTETVIDQDGNVRNSDAANTAETAAGCGTVVGYIFAGLVGLGFLISMFETF